MLQSQVRKALLTIFFPFFTAAITSAVTADPKLLSLVPPGAQIVAGMNAPSLGGQPDSFLLMTHNNTVDLEDFFALSGADSSRIIHQVIMVATEGDMGALAEHSLLASGNFDQARITRSAADGGATPGEYRGIRVLAVQPFARERGAFNDVRWLAMIGSDVALFGTIASVQLELDRHLARSTADPSLMRKLARLRRDDETWCVLAAFVHNYETRRALSSLDAMLADPSHDGDAFQFGIHYGRHVEFEYEITAASSASAQAISSSLPQSLAGTARGSSQLRGSDMTPAGGAVHGVVKVSRAQYDSWLAEVLAHARPRIAADSSRR
jgi:hypothetical protein